MDGLAHALLSQGITVTVVTNDSRNVGVGISVENGVEVVRLPCRPLLDGRLPMPKRNRIYKQLMEDLSSRTWRGILINTRLFALSIEGLKFSKQQGLTPIVLDHGSAYLSFNKPTLDFFVRRYEDAITEIVKSYNPVFYGISEKSVEWLKHFNIEARGVISNSIDAGAYRSRKSNRDFRSELNLCDDDLLVSFVGRLIPEKGVASIIQSSKSEEIRKRKIVFVLAGDGPMSEEVKQSEGHNLHWIGRTSGSDTSALLQQADLNCLPTRSEGFSTVLLEASACGTPSIVTDVGGARELIPTIEFGTIINSMSSEDLNSALCAINDDRNLLFRQSRNCRQLVEAKYSWAATAAALENAINEIQTS